MTAGQPGSFAAPSAPVPAPASGLPVLPALRGLLPRGGLARGSVVAVAEFGLLCLALAAAASADGAWCGIAGIPEAGVLAAAALGLDAGRTLLIPDPGPSWPQVVASLLDGCGLGDGHGRLRACCAQVVADGRGEAAMTRTRWLWLPGEDGGIAVADPADLPFDIDEEPPGAVPALRVVGG